MKLIPKDEYNMKKVTPLKKVLLTIHAGTSDASGNISSEPVNVEFIFGTKTHGLTPFECEIDGKPVGSEGTVYLNRENISGACGYELPFTFNCPEHSNDLYLRYKIVDVMEVAPREIVKSMAEGAGCGGRCDCGCSGH
jgi:hypothetical protein